MTQSYVSLQKLVAELQALCRAQRTGFFFITTDTNRLAQINLDNGAIVFLSFQGRHGKEAIPLLREVAAGRSRFQENAVSAFRNELPPTETILNDLDSSDGEREAVASTASIASADEGLPQETCDLLERALAEFIGPMAAILCAEYLPTAKDPEAALELLASKIRNEEHASRFRERVRAKL